MSENQHEDLLITMIRDVDLPYLVRYAAMHDLIMLWGASTFDPEAVVAACDIGKRILADGWHAPCAGHA